MIELAPMLQRLREHIPIAREGSDPEGVHQLRVVTRRLRVWLELAHMRVLDDDLTWLRNEAREVRDIDVLLADDAVPHVLHTWLEQRRGAARARLLAALDHPRTSGLLEALSYLPPCDSTSARSAIRRLARKIQQRAEGIDWAHGELESLHRLRRAVRRLRYALEWTGDDARAVKKLQSALGKLGDIRAALEYVAEFPDRAQLEDYERLLDERTAEARQAARQQWEAAKKAVEEHAR